MREYQLEFEGIPGVGKSALIAQFQQGIFIEKCDQFIRLSKQVEVDGEQCMVKMWEDEDTEDGEAKVELYMKSVVGLVMVYSVASQLSFNDAEYMGDKLIHCKDNLPLVLVGNKCDLEDERIVAKDQGQALAKRLGNCPFLETSAKTNTNVTEIFVALVRETNRKISEGKRPGENVQ